MQKLSDSELAIMQHIWRGARPVTAGGLVGAFCESRGWKIQTVNTFLTRLTEKEFLTVRKQGHQNLYSVTVSEAQYRAAETRSFLDEIHGGSVQSLMAALYQSDGLTADDVAELKRWLSER